MPPSNRDIFKYWGGANTSSPIFVYTGEEGEITCDVSYVGFIVDLATRFKGLLLYVEVIECVFVHVTLVRVLCSWIVVRSHLLYIVHGLISL